VSNPIPADTLPPDPEALARRVNGAVAADMQAQRRREYTREMSRRRDIPCDHEGRLEAIESALFTIYQMADRAEDLAAFAVERVEAE
jgi:hypothetical protein